MASATASEAERKSNQMSWRRHFAPRALALLLCGAACPVHMTAKLPPAPELFAAGVVSTSDDEFGGALAPDGSAFFFAKKTQATIRSSVIVLCVSYYRVGRWTTPEVASFSGRYKDFNPTFSPDGSKLFFVSNRPVGDRPKTDTDIWVVEKSGDGWGDPKNLGAPVNGEGYEYGCSATSDGTLYFSSAREGGKGGLDIYRSRMVDGKYAEPENLGDAVNGTNSEADPFVAPDGSYLLFTSRGRDDALVGGGAPYPRSDIYVSFNRDGKWTQAKNLGPRVNSAAEESSPSVSADGRYLFFTSERGFATIPMPKRLSYRELETRLHGPANGLGDIYRVDAAAAGIVESRAP